MKTITDAEAAAVAKLISLISKDDELAHNFFCELSSLEEKEWDDLYEKLNK